MTPIIILTGIVEKREDKVGSKDAVERKVTLKYDATGLGNHTVDIPEADADLFDAFPAGQRFLVEITPVETRPEPSAVEVAPEVDDDEAEFFAPTIMGGSPMFPAGPLG